MQERHERWLEHIAPQFPFVVSEVPRIEIAPDIEFTERVAAGNQPVIISNSASTKWRAAKLWNPEYMAANVPEFKNVQHHTNKTFFYYHSRPMESIPLVKENYKSTVATRSNMSSVDFFRNVLRPPPYNDFYYFSGDTDLLGDVMHDLYPVEPLMLKGPDFNPEESYKHRWTHVWIGPSGATSHLHYDIFHNFYSQIYGYKRFVLMAPEEMENVYLYPFLHPGGQSSQVDVENPDFEKYPKFKNVQAFEAILGPGDVLYVPPLWLHHVTALDVSMSVSVWSKSSDTKAMWDVEKQPIPVKRVWSDEKKLLGARLYLEAVIDGVLGEGSAKSFVAGVLEQRYQRLMAEVPPLNPQDQSYCVETLAVPDEEEFKKEYAQGAKVIMDQVLPRFESVSSDAVKRTWLANLCEMVAFGATDPAHAGIFLQDFVNC
jgi:hypoxia-inducible factor 1-alpha inhibitor (HIF hydroxylase)